jgi:hypothetical protein
MDTMIDAEDGSDDLAGATPSGTVGELAQCYLQSDNASLSPNGVLSATICISQKVTPPRRQGVRRTSRNPALADWIR